MSRLRIRMELNRGGVGVPLQKMARVVDEAQKFFTMLAGDVHIDPKAGEWLGLDFDNKSLHFTAEFVGPVSALQVSQFHAAFDGVTLLRRATIVQFARIAGAIEEDELIGFGLYQNDAEMEPTEWRSLSKRDALRISEEIHLLLERSGESAVESRLPTAFDPGAAAALFRERREHGGLAERVARLESELGRHSEAIETLRGNTAHTEQNLQKLLVAVDAFCDRASRQLERLPAAPPPARRKLRWAIPLTVAAVCAAAGVALYRGAFEPVPAATRAQAADPAPSPAATPVLAPPPVTPKPSQPAPPASVHVDLKAIEPTWIAVYIDGEQTVAKLIDTGQTTVIDSARQIRVRLGNAGGVEISCNGKLLGPFGRKGEVRMIEFTANGFRNVPLGGPGKTGK
jgi:hypothetical protein